MGWIDFRLIALDVDNEIGVEIGGNLGYPVGSAGMVTTSHVARSVKITASVLDTVVVSGNDDLIDKAGSGNLFIYVLNEKFARISSERFAGKT